MLLCLTRLENIAWTLETVPLNFHTMVMEVFSNYSGFSGCGTADMRYTLRRVLVDAREFAEPVYMWFVDMEKAYDHVERSQMGWLGHLFRMPSGLDPGHIGETVSLSAWEHTQKS